MKRITVYLLILAMALAIVPTSSFAFRGGHSGHGSGHYRGGRGGFVPGLIVGGLLGWGLATREYYSPPSSTYVVPPASYYTDSYDREYQLEVERLRQQEYWERQQLQTERLRQQYWERQELQAERDRLRQEQARENARRDYYGRYR